MGWDDSFSAPDPAPCELASLREWFVHMSALAERLLEQRQNQAQVGGVTWLLGVPSVYTTQVKEPENAPIPGEGGDCEGPASKSHLN